MTTRTMAPWWSRAGRAAPGMATTLRRRGNVVCSSQRLRLTNSRGGFANSAICRHPRGNTWPASFASPRRRWRSGFRTTATKWSGRGRRRAWRWTLCRRRGGWRCPYSCGTVSRASRAWPARSWNRRTCRACRPTRTTPWTRGSTPWTRHWTLSIWATCPAWAGPWVRPWTDSTAWVPWDRWVPWVPWTWTSTWAWTMCYRPTTTRLCNSHGGGDTATGALTMHKAPANKHSHHRDLQSPPRSLSPTAIRREQRVATAHIGR